MTRRPSELRHRAQVAQAKRFLHAHAGEPLALGAVARAAGSSRFHLSRMYREVTGETLNDAVVRIRIERGAAELVADPRRPISDIALAIGYQTPSAFNKAFRAALQMSPSEFRAATAGERRARLRAVQRSPIVTPRVPLDVSPAPEIRTRGPTRVIYVRELGSYPDVAAPLAWAKFERVIPSVWYRRFVPIAAAHDEPTRTAPEARRYDAGMIVARDTPVPPGASVAIWPGGTYAVFEYRGAYRYIAAAFAATFANWVAIARPRLRDAAYLEIYRSPPSTPEAELLTELWLPIEV